MDADIDMADRRPGDYLQPKAQGPVPIFKHVGSSLKARDEQEAKRIGVYSVQAETT